MTEPFECMLRKEVNRTSLVIGKSLNTKSREMIAITSYTSDLVGKVGNPKLPPQSKNRGIA